ncbi:phage terminase large subunit [Candidatus Dojkabacteria bacterium]|jgi:PBSX family phage terminase large subunit|nr:phage terminase large subunit [Candidatus Dojkabacteria bacterium]
MAVKEATANNLVHTAYFSGVPKDQLKNFLLRGYSPLPWQMKFHAEARRADQEGYATDVGCGGARGPGKSHAVFAQVTLDDCQRIPGLKALFLRQTGRAAKESFEDLIDRVLSGKINYKYRGQPGQVSFENGSKVILGGFKDERDIDQYIGIEYDIIAIEELNQLTDNKVEKLKGSLRTSKKNWRPRTYNSFNPGGIGHLYVKEKFVDPYYQHKQTKTVFIPSTYLDNPYLNVEYTDYLENLSGNLGKAWREGNFDIFDGQFFGEWNVIKHVINPFAVPKHWNRYRAYDHGRNAPACCKWYAVDEYGQVFVYRELYKAGMNVDELAKEIVRLSEGEEYVFSVADPSIFAQHGFVDSFGGQTIAESFARQGVIWTPASNRRVDGWSIMHQYLDCKSGDPKMRYFNTCHDSIRTIPGQIHDDKKPEDLDTKGEDHAVDTDRYFLLALHESSAPRLKTETELKLDKMKESSGLSPEALNEFYYKK